MSEVPIKAWYVVKTLTSDKEQHKSIPWNHTAFQILEIMDQKLPKQEDNTLCFWDLSFSWITSFTLSRAHVLPKVIAILVQ